jgi:hypothetical protein
MSAVVCAPMPGRLATYRVTVCDDLVLGFIRLDVPAQKWIARTPGSATAAASMRRFSDRPAAVQWLADREPAPGIGKSRRVA